MVVVVSYGFGCGWLCGYGVLHQSQHGTLSASEYTLIFLSGVFRNFKLHKELIASSLFNCTKSSFGILTFFFFY